MPATRSIAEVPGLVLAALAGADRGVIVLGVDGLASETAVRCWQSARIAPLVSTVPSTSSTAWLTAVTGAGPAAHGVPGMVYRVGDGLVYAVTGEVLAGSGSAEPVVRPGADDESRSRS